MSFDACMPAMPKTSISKLCKPLGKRTNVLGNVQGYCKMKVDDSFAPPEHPPPLLLHEQLSFLSFQGWLPLQLPEGVQWAAAEVFADAKDFFAADETYKRDLYPANGGTDCESHRRTQTRET